VRVSCFHCSWWHYLPSGNLSIPILALCQRKPEHRTSTLAAPYPLNQPQLVKSVGSVMLWNGSYVRQRSRRTLRAGESFRVVPALRQRQPCRTALFPLLCLSSYPRRFLSHPLVQDISFPAVSVPRPPLLSPLFSFLFFLFLLALAVYSCFDFQSYVRHFLKLLGRTVRPPVSPPSRNIAVPVW